MNNCAVCGGTEFYNEAGFFFCTECQTQNEEKRDGILDLRVDGIRVTKRKLPKNNSEKTDQETQWTTWEQYNFILIGLTDELIELGATSDLKLTVLQLWAAYLGKEEVAFISTVRREIPKLARSFHKKDAEIIYGKLKARRKKSRRSASTSSIVSSLSGASSSRELNRRKMLMIRSEYDKFASSQEASESDALSLVSQSLHSIRSSGSQLSVTSERLKYSKHAKMEEKRVKRLSKKLPASKRMRYQKSHVTTKYRTGPHVITPIKLWAILYLALRIHNQNIQLADILRYGREGHLSYYRLDHLLPAEMPLTDKDVKLLTQNNEITHKGMRRTSAELAKHLSVYEIYCPDFIMLVERYCKDLNLPKGVLLYTQRLIALSPPKMIFNKLEPLIPNYEGRAMAYIVVVIKIFFGMDGITEYEISRIAEKINRKVSGFEKSGDICIIVHGGCGQCRDSVICEKLNGCKKAASLGYKKLMVGENALSAVETALRWLECDEWFNCGYGSVLNQLGEVQMDASIMDGEKLEIGSVGAVSDIEHPISLAKFILKNYPNAVIVGEGTKNLSRCMDVPLISKGNMVSPKAILALNLTSDSNPHLKFNAEDLELADLLKSSWGTTGCVAWDGHSIAAGTTTGGLSGKKVGRIGDSSFLGCGTFANNLAGCSLTGHGETIMKHGLARKVVTDIVEGCCPEDALKQNIDLMQRQTDQECGGIILQNNGCWGVYFTTPRMPYAVVNKDWITYGADPCSKKTQKYFDPDIDLPCRCNEAKGNLDSKLFSFSEWQRYIECRRNILTRKHFPTKYKNDSDGLGNTEIYGKFIKSALSRREEKIEIRSSKNTIPRVLAGVIEQCASTLEDSNQHPEHVEIFLPSLHPQQSYLEQLLENPLYDLPHILWTNFVETKVYYLTKPNKIVKCAASCGITLKVVSSRLHFIEKLVPQFQRSKMRTLTEWNTPVTVMHCNDENKLSEERVEDSFIDSEGENLQRFEFIMPNQLYYDSLQDTLTTANEKKDKGPRKKSSAQSFGLKESDAETFDFGFQDVTSEGKLQIPTKNDSDSDNESTVRNHENNLANNKTQKHFHNKYNLHLRDCYPTGVKPLQGENLHDQMYSSTVSGKKGKFIRDSRGRFVREDSSNARKEPKIYKSPRRIMPWSKNSDLPNSVQKKKISDSQSSSHPEKASVLKSNDDTAERFFIPSEDYWMYHCVFSHIKPKNFEFFESELPVSFQWLLSECADAIEMSTEDLYEQVCLIETYFAHVLSPNTFSEYFPNSKENRAKIQQTKKKW